MKAAVCCQANRWNHKGLEQQKKIAMQIAKEQEVEAINGDLINQVENFFYFLVVNLSIYSFLKVRGFFLSIHT